MEHVEIALAEKGVREFPGRYNNNPEILKYADESGLFSDGTDELPWCSAFMNWVAFKANLERSKKSDARSWLKVGLEVKKPEIGDVAVFWRGTRNGWQGHVGIFYGFTPSKKYVKVLGGNQSNKVNIQNYGTHKVLGYRRLRSNNLGDLRIGSTGEAVKDLQTKLNQTDYKCGNADGYFSKQTEESLVRLQREGNLKISGVYNEATKVLLEGIIKSQQAKKTVQKSTKTKPKETKKKTTKKPDEIETFNFDDIFNEDLFEFDWDD